MENIWLRIGIFGICYEYSKNFGKNLASSAIKIMKYISSNLHGYSYDNRGTTRYVSADVIALFFELSNLILP